jgi:hypothetical protein
MAGLEWMTERDIVSRLGRPLGAFHYNGCSKGRGNDVWDVESRALERRSIARRDLGIANPELTSSSLASTSTDPSGMQQDFLLYLDHTYLDLLAKKRLPNFLREFRGVRIVPVYSRETLEEVARSKGHERSFLDALLSVNAKLLVPRMEAARFTDEADLLEVDPHAEYQEFITSQIDVKYISLLLMQLSQAFTGARPDLRTTDLLAELRRCGLGMAKDALDQAEGLGALPVDLQSRLHDLQRALESGDRPPPPDVKQPASVEQFDQHLAGGSRHLNNMRPPKVVEQIWQQMPHARKANLSIGAFFGVECADGRKPSQAEKVQSVFNMLGILGYFRDPRLQQNQRMESLMSDMGHVAFASYCHAFATRDNRLAKRSAAAYEFVGCPTVVLPLALEKNESA